MPCRCRLLRLIADIYYFCQPPSPDCRLRFAYATTMLAPLYTLRFADYFHFLFRRFAAVYMPRRLLAITLTLYADAAITLLPRHAAMPDIDDTIHYRHCFHAAIDVYLMILRCSPFFAIVCQHAYLFVIAIRCRALQRSLSTYASAMPPSVIA